MFPPSQGLNLDIDAISQICGSVSIACWIVVFSPQIIENWKRGSADGLSVVFITIWLLGDFFNIFGAVLQGVLPTMIILAVYYTLADIVLLLQCFWYKGFTFKDEVTTVGDASSDEQDSSSASISEESALLPHRRPVAGEHGNGNGHGNGYGAAVVTQPRISDIDGRRGSSVSQSSFRERLFSIDGTHLSPATPLLDDTDDIVTSSKRSIRSVRPQFSLQTILFNFGTIVLVCAAGVFGWWLSTTRGSKNPEKPSSDPEPLQFNLWGQIFGYICAALYLGSRIPQLLLNYRRKSTEGISMLFFLFACIGNLTYVLSIVAYKPVCGGKGGKCEKGEAGAAYLRYIGVNFSWLLGSFGTLVLDAFVFVQYFLYRDDGSDSEEED